MKAVRYCLLFIVTAFFCTNVFADPPSADDISKALHVYKDVKSYVIKKEELEKILSDKKTVKTSPKLRRSSLNNVLSDVMSDFKEGREGVKGNDIVTGTIGDVEFITFLAIGRSSQINSPTRSPYSPNRMGNHRITVFLFRGVGGNEWVQFDAGETLTGAQVLELIYGREVVQNSRTYSAPGFRQSTTDNVGDSEEEKYRTPKKGLSINRESETSFIGRNNLVLGGMEGGGMEGGGESDMSEDEKDEFKEANSGEPKDIEVVQLQPPPPPPPPLNMTREVNLPPQVNNQPVLVPALVPAPLPPPRGSAIVNAFKSFFTW